MKSLNNYSFSSQKNLREKIEALCSWLPAKKPSCNWDTCVAAEWKSAWRLEGFLQPIVFSSGPSLSDLLGIDQQKHTLVQNTLQFIRGYPANHVLLTGAKGAGKSSLIRALLTDYSNQGLRFLQILPEHFSQLPTIVRQLDVGKRFILFCDDLSFEHDSGAYRALKSILDGGSFTLPEHVLIYATSNRRHLMPEFKQSAAGSAEQELHPSESNDEKISLSDRFGIWLTFYSCSQNDYLNICEHWVQVLTAQYQNKLGVSGRLQLPWNEAAKRAALQWALKRGHRSGRAGYQFSVHWVGQWLLSAKGVKS